MLRTRFAPSPTGELHLGHAVHVLYVFGVARSLGAEIQLRMEDHDRLRCQSEYADSIRHDLTWLGILEGNEPWAFQSTRQDRYAAVLAMLHENGLVYACNCSRRDLLSRHPAQTPLARGGEIPYDGHCRDRNLAFGAGSCIRLKVPDRVFSATDLILGPLEQRPSTSCGDFTLVDNRGHFTYQFCVVVDDLDHQISLVIRGEDILPSTGRQLALLEILGGRPPVYLHHPLVKGEGGEKLSKRYRSLSLAALRHSGHSAASVLGMAAFQAGLLPSERPLPPGDIASLFAERLACFLPAVAQDEGRA